MKRLRLYLRATGFLLLFIVLAVGVSLKTAFAATGQIYLSPSTSSATNGSNFSVQVKLDAGSATVDSVDITLCYDPGKLSLVGTLSAGSTINTSANYANGSCPTTAGWSAVSGGAYNQNGVSAAGIVLVTVTFNAKVSSGSTALQFSTGGAYGSNANYQGNDIGASLVNSAVNFSPTPTCPSGYTGIYPNCTAPSLGGSGSGSSGGTSAGSSAASKGNPSSSPSGSQSGATPTSDPTPTVGAPTTQYNQATVVCTSKVPTTMYLEYGTSHTNLNFKTAVSGLATSHNLTLDPSILTPGQTYYFVVVSQDQQGAIKQSGVQSFTTKGFTVSVVVADSNHKPLANQAVTLHSMPYQATTNRHGVATFSNVAPGNHELTYSSGGKTYTQPLTIANNILTATDGKQSAPPQNLSIIFPVVQHSSKTYVLVVVAIGLAGIAGAMVLLLKNRQGRLVPLAVPSSSPVVVEGNKLPSVAGDPATETLSQVPAPEEPQPGAVIAPGQNNTSDNQAVPQNQDKEI